MVVISWSIFATLITSIYTANLVSHFLLVQFEREMTTGEDLLVNHKTQFGCISNGTTMSYLQVIILCLWKM